MAIELFPRLYKPMADSCWKEISSRGIEELAALAATTHDMAAPGETGGEPVHESRLREIRSAILSIAKENGYPGNANTAAFDAACSRYLCEEAGIAEPEALRDEVWNFLSLVLLPDIVAWRFPGRAKERVLAGVRNTFQRLWLRGRLIARGDDCHEPDWDLMSDMTEDAFVAVIERPRLSASPLLAREFAEAWRRCDRQHKGNMESIHRLAARNVMATKTVISLESLEKHEVGKIFDDHFSQAVAEVGG